MQKKKNNFIIINWWIKIRMINFSLKKLNVISIDIIFLLKFKLSLSSDPNSYLRTVLFVLRFMIFWLPIRWILYLLSKREYLGEKILSNFLEILSISNYKLFCSGVCGLKIINWQPPCDVKGHVSSISDTKELQKRHLKIWLWILASRACF